MLELNWSLASPHYDGTIMETSIVNQGSHSMPFYYGNTGGAASETQRTFDKGQDWTVGGIKTLSIMLYGDPNNTGQLYVKINSTKITYPYDAADIARVGWLQWDIDLTALSGLQNVTSLTIGVDDVGATGMLYIDDMHLSPAAASAPSSGLSIYYRADNVDGAGTPGDGSTTTLVNLANPGQHDGTIIDGVGVVQNPSQAGTPFAYGVVLTGHDSTKSHISTSYQIGGGVDKVAASTWEYWLRTDSGPYVDRGALYGEFDDSGDPTRHYLRLGGIGTDTRNVSYDEWPPSGGNVVSYSPLFDTGTFTQIVVTRSGDDTMTFYRDGVQVGIVQSHAETYAGGDITQTLLGIRPNGNSSFAGQFNIIRLYDVVLSAADVLENYTTEIGK